jgi:hypothetical protein
MHLAASSAQAAAKRRAVDPVHILNVLLLYKGISGIFTVYYIPFYTLCGN